jgi:hypothetical protein
MYSIEEVVKKHLQEEYCKKCTERNDCSFDIDEECSSVFMKKLKIANLGAVWILSHQWTNVKDRLPDKNEQVLCKMKSNVAVISDYIFVNELGKAQVSTDPLFEFAD